jgi:uncharacterized membrane protein YidH (DUF202 family)
MANELAGSPIAPGLRPWVARMVRLGYVAKGVLYLLIGTLAFRLAAGLEGGRLLDPTGALRIVFRQPFGVVLLLIVGVGILNYSAWQLVEAIWDTRRKGGGWGWWGRSLTIIKGVAYGSLGVQAIRIVLGIRASRSSELAAEVIRFPFGGLFFALVGMGVAIYGLFEIKNAVKSKFGEDLDRRRLEREAGKWATFIGRIGNGARGIILTVMGSAFVTAGLDRDPQKAAGIPEALRTLFAQPFGIVLVAFVGGGLALFGVFQLLHARYVRL